MKEYENGDITREQFLRMVSIGKQEAKNVLGGDQVADFTVKVIGKKVDVRMSQLPVEQMDDEFIMERGLVRTKIKRKVFGRSGQAKVAAPVAKEKRKVRVRVKK